MPPLHKTGALRSSVTVTGAWHDRRGQGQVDFEATVKFATNGSDPTIRVVLLDSRGTLN